jgi:hypothetical protein
MRKVSVIRARLLPNHLSVNYQTKAGEAGPWIEGGRGLEDDAEVFEAEPASLSFAFVQNDIGLDRTGRKYIPGGPPFLHATSLSGSALSGAKSL